MPLIDDLIAAGRTIPPSHLPNVSDLAGIVGALAAHIQHGQSFLDAADKGAEAVADLLGTEQAKQEQEAANAATTPQDTPAAPKPAAPHAATVETPDLAPDAPEDSPTRAELIAQINSLQAQLAASNPPTVTS